MTEKEVMRRVDILLRSFSAEDLSLEEGLSVLVTTLVNVAVREQIPLETVFDNIEGAYLHVSNTLERLRTDDAN